MHPALFLALTVVGPMSGRPVLLVALLALLLAGATHGAPQEQQQPQQPGIQGYSCDDVSAVPQPDRCTFVRAQCDSDGWIPYAEWYYCHVEPRGRGAHWAFIALLVALLPLLFTLLGDTAELYFSPTMSLVAQTIPGMRPRFAGVTFVAMGNGAPDLSSNISALRLGHVALSAGAITGAAMFVQCIVASEVIRIAGGVKCRGATLRDVGVYALSVAGVGLSLLSGKITHWFVAGTIVAYLGYVAWVFLGDEWHARGRPDFRPGLSWHELIDALAERQYFKRNPDERREVEVGHPVVHTAVPAASGPCDSDGALNEALLPWAPMDDMHLPGTDLEDPMLLSHGELASGSDASEMTQGPSVALPALDSGPHMAPPPPLLRNFSRPMAIPSGHFDPFAPPQGEPVQLRTHASHQGEAPPALASTGGAGGGRLQPRFHSRPASSHHNHFLSARTYKQAVWADLGWETANHARHRLAVEASRHAPHASHATPGTAIRPDSDVASDTSSLELTSTSTTAQPLRGAGTAHSQGHGPRAHGNGYLPPHPSQLGEPGLPTVESPHSTATLSVSGGASEATEAGKDGVLTVWELVCRELSLGTCEEWAEMPGWQRGLRTGMFAMLLPVYAALRFTIPLVDPETYSQRWLVASLLGGPLAIAVYFGVATSLLGLGVALVVGGCMAWGMHVLTRSEMDMPLLDLGTRFAFGPGLVSLMGFFMGVLWIDTLASEVVGVITLVSTLMDLPPSLVGLTMLAWGNSLGDFFGNQAMARRGASSTALTACFAAPLFNLLISMSMGFSAYFSNENTNMAHVSLPHGAALGVVCLVVYNIILAIVGIMHGYRLPARFYLFARAWYLFYLLAAGALALFGPSESSDA